MIDLSIVIPVRDEEKNLDELIFRCTETVQKMALSHEIIFVTDTNKDNTYEILKSFHEQDPRIKIVKLSSSFGQYVAIMAGLQFTKGNAVVTMDGDLQDHPEDIEKLYGKYSEGYDVVYGIKEKKDDSQIRNILSGIFIKLLNKLSDQKLDHNTNIFRIMSRRTVEGIRDFKEIDPSLTGITNLIGFPVAKVLVTSGERHRGETKYSALKLFNLAVSMLLSFSTKPIRIISFSGILVALLSFLYLFWVITGYLLFDTDVQGWPTIVSMIAFIGGMQLLAIGVIGEYIGRIFLETKRRPLFIIEDKIGI